MDRLPSDHLLRKGRAGPAVTKCHSQIGLATFRRKIESIFRTPEDAGAAGIARTNQVA